MVSFVAEITENPESNKAYHDWLALPWTQRVLAQVKSEGIVAEPSPTTVRAENALIEVGKNVGWHNCLERIQRLDANVPASTQDLNPSFGAEDAMREINDLLKKHFGNKQKGTP
jgi:hypothetical protein